MMTFQGQPSGTRPHIFRAAVLGTSASRPLNSAGRRRRATARPTTAVTGAARGRPTTTGHSLSSLPPPPARATSSISAHGAGRRSDSSSTTNRAEQKGGRVRRRGPSSRAVRLGAATLPPALRGAPICCVAIHPSGHTLRRAPGHPAHRQTGDDVSRSGTSNQSPGTAGDELVRDGTLRDAHGADRTHSTARGPQ
jgi:hypothetical protein